MGKFNVLVVLYNRRIDESRTLIGLKDVAGIEVTVADNSTRETGNREFAKQASIQYVDMGGNKGLSKAYNAVLDRLEKNDELLCLFDDDTTVSKEYFEKLAGAAERYPEIDLFAPIVRDRIGMLSPCIIHGVNARRANTLEDIPARGISVINSGLAVRLKVFNRYRYDEGLFLDYVDHAFIKDVIQNDQTKIHIIDTELRQHFSGSEKQDKRGAMERYAVFKRDISYFCEKYGIKSLNKTILLMKRRLHLFFTVS